jgi:hypothetical protein
MASASVSESVRFNRSSLLTLGSFDDFPLHKAAPPLRRSNTVDAEENENFASRSFNPVRRKIRKSKCFKLLQEHFCNRDIFAWGTAMFRKKGLGVDIPRGKNPLTRGRDRIKASARSTPRVHVKRGQDSAFGEVGGRCGGRHSGIDVRPRIANFRDFRPQALAQNLE